MTPDNRKQIRRLVAEMASSYNVELTDLLVASYCRALEDTDPQLARDAASQLMGGSKWMPKADDIAKQARRLEAEAARSTAEPEHWRRDTFSCLDCRDTGHLEVWGPDAMRAAIRFVAGQASETDLQAACGKVYVVRCGCPVGQKLKRPEIQFDPGKHWPRPRDLFVWRGHESVADLLERARGWKPSNFEPAFQDWNEHRPSQLL